MYSRKTMKSALETMMFMWGEPLEVRDAAVILEADKDIQSIPIIFWVLWIILTSGIIFGFVYLENDWLEDNKKKE